MVRGAVLGVAVAFTALLGLLTLFVLVESGLDVLVVASLLVVVVLAVGVGGSLRR
jgi:hypothetical protein